MTANKTPLHYAILKLFMDGSEKHAGEIVETLRDEYAGYKLLTLKDVDETLATAKENGLLDETSCDLDGQGALRIFYQINDFGREMVDKYL